MLKKAERFLIALVPIGFLIVLLAFFIGSIRTYIQCEPQSCAQCVDKKCGQCAPDRCVPGDAKNCESMLCSLEDIILKDEETTAETQPQHSGATGKPEEAKKPDPVKPERLKKQETTALRINGRTTFVFLANLYFLVCLIAAGVSLYIIYNSLKESVFYGWMKDVFYAALGSFLMAFATIGIAVLLYIFSDLYLQVFGFLLGRGIANDLPQAGWLLRVVNSFGFSVCIMLYLAVGTVIFSPVRRTNPEGLLEASQKMKYLRTILYLGTLMLIIGMLLIRAVHQWSLVFMPRSETAIKMAENFFSNLLALDGGFFTMLLAAAYLPSALIVRWQAEQIQGLPLADTEKEKELQKYHLTFSFTESLPKIIAILGPILAGPVGELFTKLIK
jgi:hypothetical protein